MKKLNRRVASSIMMLTIAMIGFAGVAALTLGQEAEGAGEHRLETSAEASEENDVAGSATGGEEDGTLLALDETYDRLRLGARLLLRFDAVSGSFYGLAQNSASKMLQQVRVEVHLSNGVELGPTTAVDLAPGEVMAVLLRAESQTFDGWTPHAEVGLGEQGPENENESGSGEHSKGEGRREHANNESDGD